MFKLFRLIFGRNIRSIGVLFFVLFLSSTGFLVMRQLTENIEIAVSRETQPIFGADIRISPRNYTPEPIISILSPYLSGVSYSWWERTEFSTTLFDQEGKTGLINVVAYSGSYPQKWILELESLGESNSGYIAATDDLIARFSLSGILKVDEIPLTLTHRILKSSDLGFSFGSDNHLLILPIASLSSSSLVSSGSRLDQDLLLSFGTGFDIVWLSDRLKTLPELDEYRITNYTERSEQTLDTTEELGNYILLILVIAAIFAGIILRSSHDALFADLARTLRIVETLGFSRRRQIRLFFLLYGVIIPLSFFCSLLASAGIIEMIRLVPEASDFRFLFLPIIFTGKILLILINISFLPAWWEKIGSILPQALHFQEVFSSFFLEKIWKRRFSFLSFFGFSSFWESSLLVLWIFWCIFLIFERFFWSLFVTAVALVIFLFLSGVLLWLYRRIFVFSSRWRMGHFALYDGVRALVRPLTPSIPLTISLLGITLFFVVFAFFSLSFRDRLLADTRDTANIYAINILESDRENVEKVLSGAEMYSIMRVRISAINGKSLKEHLQEENPSREFTREFNVTTDTVDVPIIRGERNLGSNQVSVDEDFSKRLGVDIGDSIEFLLSGKKVSLAVANIRKSVREGFRPFFYFSFQKDAFKTAPKTYFIAGFASDTEAWRKMILGASGPHVTFIDIENILTIARTIATKILSVISLFLGAISIFGILAILSLFARLGPIEAIKSRLYSLFGASKKILLWSFRSTRIVILLLSGGFAYILGISLYTYMIRSSAFLHLGIQNVILIGIAIFIFYFLLYIAISPRSK